MPGRKFSGYQEQCIRIGPLLIGLLLLFFVGLSLYYLHDYPEPGDYLLMGIFGVPGIFLTGWGVWSVVRWALPNRRLLPAEIEFRPFPAYLGERVRGRLTQEVRQRSKINTVTVALVYAKLTEYPLDNGGSMTDVQELFRHEKTLDVSATIEPPEKICGVFSFDLPSEVPGKSQEKTSFGWGIDKQISFRWWVEVHTDIANCPDYNATFPLGVYE